MAGFFSRNEVVIWSRENGFPSPVVALGGPSKNTHAYSSIYNAHFLNTSIFPIKSLVRVSNIRNFAVFVLKTASTVVTSNVQSKLDYFNSL